MFRYILNPNIYKILVQIVKFNLGIQFLGIVIFSLDQEIWHLFCIVVIIRFVLTATAADYIAGFSVDQVFRERSVCATHEQIVYLLYCEAVVTPLISPTLNHGCKDPLLNSLSHNETVYYGWPAKQNIIFIEM